MDRILPQICTVSAYANMKHALKQMQYRFALIYETPSKYNSGRIKEDTGYGLKKSSEYILGVKLLFEPVCPSLTH